MTRRGASRSSLPQYTSVAKDMEVGDYDVQHDSDSSPPHSSSLVTAECVVTAETYDDDNHTLPCSRRVNTNLSTKSAFFVGALCALLIMGSVMYVSNSNNHHKATPQTTPQTEADATTAAKISSASAIDLKVTEPDSKLDLGHASVDLDPPPAEEKPDQQEEEGIEKDEKEDLISSSTSSNFGNHPQKDNEEKGEQEEELKTVVEKNENDTKSNDKPWYKQAWDSVFGKKEHRTKLAGGGRDWLLNAVDGTIASKKDPSLLVGLGPAHLILVPKDDERALHFYPVKNDKQDGDDTSAGTKIRVSHGNKEDDSKDYLTILNHQKAWKFGQYSVLDTIVASDVEPTYFSYKENNYITTLDGFTLDIADWKIVEGTKLNLVRDETGKTYTAGGGRDFDWKMTKLTETEESHDNDYTISPKLNPDLVIGASVTSLILTRNPSRVLHIVNAQELADGRKAVPMKFHLQGKDKPLYQVILSKTAGVTDGWRWHLSETSRLFHDDNDDAAVKIKYDGNFLLTSDESYALDVSYWKMEPWNTVNFVGATDGN